MKITILISLFALFLQCNSCIFSNFGRLGRTNNRNGNRLNGNNRLTSNNRPNNNNQLNGNNDQNDNNLYYYDDGDVDDYNEDDNENDNESDNDNDDENDEMPISDLKNFCNCRIGVNSRIVNGKISPINAFPWHVSLATKISRSHFCGGTIINQKLILTAAHCVFLIPSSLITVRVGINDLRDANSRNTFLVSKVILQNEIVKPGKPSDIAIIELSRPINFVRNKIEPGCFDLSKKNYGSGLIAVGFGATTPLQTTLGKPKNLLTPSKELRQAQFKETTANCKSFLICIRPIQPKSSICQGDSGSPIHFTKAGRTTVEGVASYGTGRKLKGSNRLTFCNGEAAFTRASYHKNWFENNVGADSYCKV